MTTCAILVARMGSSRLPGKSLMDVEGAPMLSRLVERVSQARRIDKIVIATTTLTEDGPLEALAQALDVECFRGSSDDVLGRVKAAAGHTDRLHGGWRGTGPRHAPSGLTVSGACASIRPAVNRTKAATERGNAGSGRVVFWRTNPWLKWQP